MDSISVIIPAHNAGATIVRAVRSAQQQRLRAREIIVVDDGSADDTGRLARDAGARVLRHSQPQGAAAARDDGIRTASSPCVALLDADDAFLEDHLAANAALMTDPSVVLTFSRALELREDGSKRLPPVDSDADLRRPLWALAWRNLVPTSGSVLRVAAYVQSEGFDRTLIGAWAEDYDLWLRLARLGPFACTGAVGVHRFVTNSSASRRQDALERMLQNGLYAVHKTAPHVVTQAPWLPRIATAHIRREAARRFLASGLASRAREESAKAIRTNPADAAAWELWALSHAPPQVVGVLQLLNARVQDVRARFTAV